MSDPTDDPRHLLFDDADKGKAPAEARTVATVLLPFNVQALATIVEQLVAEHGSDLRMRYEGEFMVFFKP